MNESGEVRLHFLDYWRVVRARWGLILLVFFLVVITAGITTALMPKEYASTVQIEVKEDDGLRIFDRAVQAGSDPRFSATQFYILQSKEILYPVIKKLGLVEKWSARGGRWTQEQVFLKLRKMLDMDAKRNSDIIEVTVYSIDSEEAARIANAIADEYIVRRQEIAQSLSSSGLGELRKEIDQQRKKVEDAFAEMSKIRERDKIIDANPEQIETIENVDIRVVVQAEQATNDERVRVATLSTQIEQLDKLAPAALVATLSAMEVNDPTLLKVLPSYIETTTEEARLVNSGLGENHPKVKAVRAQSAILLSQLTTQVGAIRNALASKLAASRATLAALEGQLEDARRRYLGARAMSGDYLEAKNRYIQAKKVLEASETKAETERIQTGISMVPAQIWARAEPAVNWSRPQVLTYMGLAVLLGAFAGIGFAFFFEYLDTSVKTVDEVERFLGLPVLAVIPNTISNLLRNGGGDTPDAEAYRILRTNIEFTKRDPDANTLTVISGGPGEGKSTTIANLAATMAHNGSSVLVVDADLRRPSQHRLFEMRNSPGLADYLLGKMELEAVIRPGGLENLWFLPSGKLPVEHVGILNQERLSKLLARLKGRYDYILFDSPPILGVSDGSVVASEVDMSIIVVQHRRFPRSMLMRVKQAVQHAGGNLLGIVLNKVDPKHDAGGAYYGGYGHYYSMTEPVEEKPRQAAKPVAAPARGAARPEDY
jgi:succinoglycan biosynthesis transport protein ExoP